MVTEITRDQAREALRSIDAACKEIAPALDAAPHGLARHAVDALNRLSSSVATALGVEVIGDCEGCQTKIFDGDDHILTTDGCWLCMECKPDDEHLERLRAIQANCPKGDPECEAQTHEDHERCAQPGPAARGRNAMTAPTIIAWGEDLTTACMLGRTGARQSGAALVRWGEVEFEVVASDTLERAHARFFAAARLLREHRERGRVTGSAPQ